MPPQWMITGPALIEGVKRMNAVMIRRRRQGIEALRRNSYAMEMDRGRNCYACGGFRHMACHCRNWGQKGRMAEGRRLEYRGEGIERNYEQLNHLKEVENLKSLD